MNSAITVGFSTRTHKPDFIEYLKKSSGFKKINVIEKITNGEKSLSQVYNEILNESTTDIVVLCHDDIYFDTTSWYNKILNHFQKREFGILGIAGTTYMPQTGKWWEMRNKMYGIVNHEHKGKKWESKYSSSLGNDIKEVVVVDGLFLALRKSKLKKSFDETVPGFHFYDIEFCFQNFLEGVKLGVIFNVRVTHKSIGETNEQWEINRKSFESKYSNQLPKFVGKTIEEKMKCLFVPSQIESDYDRTKKSIDFLINQKIEVEVLLDESKPVKKLYETLKCKKHLLSLPPGYKVGDGKWSHNNNGAIELSRPGMLYLMSDPNFDFILLESESNYKKIIELYSSSTKITNLNLQRNKNHRSIKGYYREVSELSLSSICDFINSEYSDLLKKDKIKIISGHSEKGGSTTAFIKLTNELNNLGYDVTFYGPHSWHIDKCKSGYLKEVVFEQDDILITHFLNLGQRPNVKKVILGLHEKNLYEVSKIKPFWDTVVFLNQKHREYHSNYHGIYEIIPNLTETLIHRKKSNLDRIAGIVGTIDMNKQTHLSIERALADGCEKIYLFGSITEQSYHENYVLPLLSDKVIHFGFIENKQEMYDMVGRVYLSSISEVAPLVKQECSSTGTKFFGNSVTDSHDNSLNNEQILEKWIQLIQK